MNQNELTSRLAPLFLFSLPRSGSTLCQRILGAHPKIATVNEPHILLPLFYSLKETDIRSTYNHLYAAWAIQDFCTCLPNGRADYLAEIREMAMHLYQKASGPSAEYFLDKTPKYHLITDEIIDLFTEGKYIFLWRNPLSIISSLIETWGGGAWNIFHFKVDLFQGLDNLIRAYLKHQQRSYAFRFEDLLLDPIPTAQGIFDYLGLPFIPGVLENFSRVHLEGRVHDPNSNLEQYQVMVHSPLDKWKKTLSNPLRKSWALSYLRWVGNERLAVMGYDLDSLMNDVENLPSGLHDVPQDAVRMPLGVAYHLFELQLFKRKYQTWRSGEQVYMHN